MTARKDGGPAFPRPMGNNGLEGYEDHRSNYEQTGMSLRDWFAGQVISGFMSQSHAGPKDWTVMGHGWGEDCANDLNQYKTATAHSLSAFAYQVADAMLAARARGEQP